MNHFEVCEPNIANDSAEVVGKPCFANLAVHYGDCSSNLGVS